MKLGTTTLLAGETKATSLPPLNAYDIGWIVLCIGMAIGVGIVFLPVQMGVKGFWVSVVSLIIAYPAVYLLQRLYVLSLSATEGCENYAHVITQYLGKNWGAVMGVLYFLMLLKGMLSYAGAITNDSASYLKTFGVTETSLNHSLWYVAALLGFVVLIASQGERLLFRVSGPMIIVKLSIIVFLGVSMVPYWNVAHLSISQFPDFLSIGFLRDVLLTLPFALFSILYVQILNPMNVAYRKVEKDRSVATARALRSSRYAYWILFVCVLFFGFSFMLSTSHENAMDALRGNISALALAAKVIPGDTVRVLSTVLNIAAILTALFSAYLGFHDALKGIVINVADRIMIRGETFSRILPVGIALFTVALLSTWVMFGLSTMALLQVSAPLTGIVSCLIPCYLVIKIPALRHLKSPAILYIAFFGAVLVASPFFKLLEK